MSFDWEHYLEVADECVRDSSNNPKYREAYLRAAVSRAYYAVFCKTRYLLMRISRYMPSKDENAHQDLIYELTKDSEDKALMKIGRFLIHWRRVRNYADYDNSFLDADTKALTIIAQARDVMKSLRELQKKSSS